MRGCHDDGVDIGGVEHVDAQPRLVDRDLDDLQPERPKVVAALPLGRVLERDPPRAILAQDRRHQLEALGEPRADHDVVGVGRRPAHPIEVLGERAAQLRHAAPVEVAEPLAGCLVERPPDRAQPGGPREQVEVGTPRPEVVRDRDCGGTGWARRCRAGGGRDLGRARQDG